MRTIMRICSQIFSYILTAYCPNDVPHFYRQISNIRRTLEGNKLDNSDVVGASPVGAAPTTSSLST